MLHYNNRQIHTYLTNPETNTNVHTAAQNLINIKKNTVYITHTHVTHTETNLPATAAVTDAGYTPPCSKVSRGS